jgi:AcrR family transcriptional regulator
MALDALVGRSASQRTDARQSRDALVAAVGEIVGRTGVVPARLSEVAAVAGVSTATAYRHFASAAEVVSAHLLQLPEFAVSQFSRQRPAADPVDRLHQWNTAWVGACRAFGPTSVFLRSPAGFLARREVGDGPVTFVCNVVEPLLAAVDPVDPLSLLLVWNAISDPREVLDMERSLGWGSRRIARFLTDTTVAASSRH